MNGGLQNLDSIELVARILRSKGLGIRTPPLGGNAELVPDCFGSVRTVPLCAFHILGQGCSSHDWDIFLWRAVEK
jgi:hypothetical protein